MKKFGTITCWESNESATAKNKRLRASENRDKSTRKERTEHKEHDEKLPMLNSCPDEKEPCLSECAEVVQVFH